MSNSATKVCFDLRPLQIGHENRGIGMHIKSVLTHLPHSKDVSFVFYCFSDSNPIADLAIDIQAPYEIITTPKRTTQIKNLSNLIDVARLSTHGFNELKNQGISCFVQFDFMLGLPKIKAMRTIIVGYDLIPLIYSNVYNPGVLQSLSHTVGKKAKARAVLRSIYYQLRYALSYRVFKRAGMIAAISDSTRESFVSLLQIKPEKIQTISLAPVALSSGVSLEKTKLTDKPYLFYIGGTDFRKRIQDVVHIYNIVRGRGHNVALILAGNEFTDVKTIPSAEGRRAIKRSPYQQDIHLAGFVTDEEKNGLFSKAVCFVFPSMYEGYGLPVLEAMLARCPVVCYDNSSLAESSGGFATMVDSFDFMMAANAVIGHLDAPSSSAKTAQQYAKSLSWDTHTQKLLALAVR